MKVLSSSFTVFCLAHANFSRLNADKIYLASIHTEPALFSSKGREWKAPWGRGCLGDFPLALTMGTIKGGIFTWQEQYVLKINFLTIRIFSFAIRTFHIILQPWLVFYRVQLHQGDRYCSTKITHYSFFHHHAFLPFIERAVVINRLRCTRFPCRKYQLKTEFTLPLVRIRFQEPFLFPISCRDWWVFIRAIHTFDNFIEIWIGKQHQGAAGNRTCLLRLWN